MIVKLLFTLIAIAALWFGLKYVSRMSELKGREAERREREVAAAKKLDGTAEDMAQCRSCGAYVPARGATSCGRPDCPFPR